MSAPAAESLDAPERRADRRRLSAPALFFLAAGGVIGSGWTLGGLLADQGAGSWAVFSWLIGGGLMLVIASVMVILSTVAPKTGGLIFLPLQASGPVLATVVAAGLWVFYAINPASEAVAMTRALSGWTQARGVIPAHGNGLTGTGLGWAVALMLAVTAVNLLGPRLFLVVNGVLTVFKILVPVLIVLLLLYAELHPSGRAIHVSAAPAPLPTASVASSGASSSSGHNDLATVLTTVTANGVIYAYLGFQGPLDFAGSVRRSGRGEAARMRRAVYGTVCGSILLYVALQLVVVYLRHHTGSAQTPYTDFAQTVAPSWAAHPMSILINLDQVLSPAGAAMVFTYVLTREVAALSRAHLTHRGLQMSRYSVIAVRGARLRRLVGERLDVYWLILIVDFVISTVALLCMDGNWIVLGSITTVLALVVYVTPSVVLAALGRGARRDTVRRRHRVLAEAAFVSIAVIFLLAGWDRLWPGMTALTVGCVLLFGMPKWADGRRWYDARLHAPQLLRLRGEHANSARSAWLLYGFFGVITLVSLLNEFVWPTHLAVRLATAVPVAALAAVVFRALVDLSEQYMAVHPPTLPEPMRARDAADGAAIHGLEPALPAQSSPSSETALPSQPAQASG
ncbi:APC family permease [Actinospica durhamensis]|uniref:APC family permease n=1 Tax=Actinospica durhamensis TaxID=1508375 RepID=A0A941ILD8_9ACTN|nr:APC family permease [Actinospica durhamensis]MBR7832890.1 APC family permease [Actinospica durhamensis]